MVGVVGKYPQVAYLAYQVFGVGFLVFLGDSQQDRQAHAYLTRSLIANRN